MQQAKGCRNEMILTQAIGLAADLRDEGLLFESTYQEERDLQVEFREVVYQRLKQAVEIDWDAVSKNRKSLLDIPGITRTDAWEDQYREALCKSKEVEAERLAQQQGPGAAQEYLEAVFRESLLAQREARLVQRLIKLYWEAQAWDKASAAVANFFSQDLYLENGEQLTTTWQGLTRAAQHLAGCDLRQARTLLAQLEIDFPQDAALKAERKALLQRTLQRLIGEAQAAEARRTEEGDFEAAEKYALAYQIDPERPQPDARPARPDSRVVGGLQNLGRRLEPGIQRRCMRARQVAIGASLSKALQEAECLLQTLQALHSVAHLLGVSEPTHKALLEMVREEGYPVGVLVEKKRFWQEVNDRLERSEERLKEALRSPAGFAAQVLGGGASESLGWDFSRALEVLDHLPLTVDEEAQRLLWRQRQRILEQYDAPAKDLLENHIRPLMKAVQREEFQAVIERAEKLALVWDNLQAQNRAWGGLASLIGYEYPGDPPFTATAPRQHRDHARKQHDNFAEWKQWREMLQKASDHLDLCRIEMMAGAIEELLMRKSLKEIDKGCSKTIQACNEFMSVVGKQPKGPPLSNAAQSIALQPDEGRIRDIVTPEDGLRTRMRRLGGEARKRRRDFERMNGPMHELRRNYANVKTLAGGDPPRKKVAASALNVFQRALETCKQIDAHHVDVLKFETFLAAIEDL